MSKLLKALKENKMTLIVELAENKAELAQAVEAAGAGALILKADEDAEAVQKAVKLPVGIDLSIKEKLSEKDLKSFSKFDFITFHHQVLPEIGKQIKSGRIIALNDEFTIDKLIGVEDSGAQAIDAAIIPLSQKGRELIVGDLQNYIAIAISSNLPVIVPTQREIKPSEVAIISDTGAKGMILTQLVLGEDAKAIEKNLKEYVAAVDDLGA